MYPFTLRLSLTISNTAEPPTPVVVFAFSKKRCEELSAALGNVGHAPSAAFYRFRFSPFDNPKRNKQLEFTNTVLYFSIDPSYQANTRNPKLDYFHFFIRVCQGCQVIFFELYKTPRFLLQRLLTKNVPNVDIKRMRCVRDLNTKPERSRVVRVVRESSFSDPLNSHRSPESNPKIKITFLKPLAFILPPENPLMTNK